MMRWIVASLTAGLLVSCGGIGTQPGYPLPADFASAIPADTVTLAGGRLDLVQKSAVFAKLEPNLPAGAGSPMETFTKRFGLDPRKDIKEFVTAFNGRDAVLLVSGSFDAPSLIELLGANGQPSQGVYKRRPMVGTDRATVAALSKTMLAGGSVARLRECIDRLDQSAKLDPRWAAGLRSLPATAQLWLLTAGGATLNLPQGGNLGNIDKVLGSVDSVTGWADLTTNFHLAATATARDAAAAKQLHTQLRGLIGMGRLSTPDDKPELLKFYDGVQTKLDDKKIDLDVDVPPANLELLLKQLRQ